VTTKEFIVCLDEIQQNFVFGDRFVGSYTRTVAMSDGSTRTIKLTPMIRNEEQVVELNDNGHISYMGLHSTTTNGKLMVQILEIPEELRGKFAAQGVIPTVDQEPLFADEISCADSIRRISA
jgi:hypothetical protein